LENGRIGSIIKLSGYRDEVQNWLLFLPPYSPDKNPIEMAFSKLKAHLRRMKARTFGTLFESVAEACELFPQQECQNYFRAAGHVAH
jgi:transposase